MRMEPCCRTGVVSEVAHIEGVMYYSLINKGFFFLSQENEGNFDYSKSCSKTTKTKPLSMEYFL